MTFLRQAHLLPPVPVYRDFMHRFFRLVPPSHVCLDLPPPLYDTRTTLRSCFFPFRSPAAAQQLAPGMPSSSPPDCFGPKCSPFTTAPFVARLCPDETHFKLVLSIQSASIVYVFPPSPHCATPKRLPLSPSSQLHAQLTGLRTRLVICLTRIFPPFSLPAVAHFRTLLPPSHSQRVRILCPVPHRHPSFAARFRYNISTTRLVHSPFLLRPLGSFSVLCFPPLPPKSPSLLFHSSSCPRCFPLLPPSGGLTVPKCPSCYFFHFLIPPSSHPAVALRNGFRSNTRHQECSALTFSFPCWQVHCPPLPSVAL